jgi:ABC-type transport system substrate-binding protein
MDLLQIVKSYFADVGIDMEIRTMDNASWQSFVGTGHKQDQLASLSTGGITGKAVEPIISLNKFIKTMAPNNYLMYFDPVYDDFYAKAIAASSVDVVKKIVRDQDEYWLRQHATISILQPMTYTFVQPWLKGHDGQYGATYGSWGPSYLFFYPPRFWVDQNVKKSMGH